MKYYKFTTVKEKWTHVVPADKVYLVRIPADTIDPARVCVTGLDHPYPVQFGAVSELQVIDEEDLEELLTEEGMR